MRYDDTIFMILFYNTSMTIIICIIITLRFIFGALYQVEFRIRVVQSMLGYYITKIFKINLKREEHFRKITDTLSVSGKEELQAKLKELRLKDERNDYILKNKVKVKP